MIDGLLEAFFLFHSIWHRRDRSIAFAGGIKRPMGGIFTVWRM